MQYTSEQLEAISLKLRDMPKIEKKKQSHSKQEAVRILSREILAMQKRGYTLDQISETLRGEGLAVATPTLKSYLQRSKTAKKPVPAKEGKTAASANKEGVKSTFTPREDTQDI